MISILWVFHIPTYPLWRGCSQRRWCSLYRAANHLTTDQYICFHQSRCRFHGHASCCSDIHLRTFGHPARRSYRSRAWHPARRSPGNNDHQPIRSSLIHSFHLNATVRCTYCHRPKSKHHLLLLLRSRNCRDSSFHHSKPRCLCHSVCHSLCFQIDCLLPLNHFRYRSLSFI